jgi:hypothetical protein
MIGMVLLILDAMKRKKSLQAKSSIDSSLIYVHAYFTCSEWNQVRSLFPHSSPSARSHSWESGYRLGLVKNESPYSDLV